MALRLPPSPFGLWWTSLRPLRLAEIGFLRRLRPWWGTAPGFTLLLPAEMREVYRVRVNESRIDGRASYSRFRQCTVTTTEKPKGQ